MPRTARAQGLWQAPWAVGQQEARHSISTSRPSLKPVHGSPPHRANPAIGLRRTSQATQCVSVGLYGFTQ